MGAVWADEWRSAAEFAAAMPYAANPSAKGAESAP